MDRSSLYFIMIDIHKAIQSKRESKRIEFKESFDVESNGDWCEIIKDVIAISNSGGGVIIIGLRNNGTISKWDPTALLEFDSAKITEKIAKYIGRQFDQFDITTFKRARQTLVAINIGESDMPLVFVNPGTYEYNGKQKTAFGRGTLYFRHGAKSEPAKQEDIDLAFSRVIEHRRKTWFKGIRKVIGAKPGDTFQVVKPPATGSVQSIRGRITGDKNAIAIRPDEADSLWPNRQSDVTKKVNSILAGAQRINSYDLQVIKKQYNIDTKHPEFYYRPFIKSSPQYSDAYIDWLVAEFKKDPSFFKKARTLYSDDG